MVYLISLQTYSLDQTGSHVAVLAVLFWVLASIAVTMSCSCNNAVVRSTKFHLSRSSKTIMILSSSALNYHIAQTFRFTLFLFIKHSSVKSLLLPTEVGQLVTLLDRRYICRGYNKWVSEDTLLLEIYNISYP